MAANLTQILNFKTNFEQEFKLLLIKKNYVNNGRHFKIVSIVADQPSQYSVIFESGRIANRNRVHLKLDRTVPLTLSPNNPDKNVPIALLPDNSDITIPFTPQSDDNPTPPSPTNINNNIPPISEQLPNPTQELPQEPRRSSRVTKKPSRFKDYVNI